MTSYDYSQYDGFGEEDNQYQGFSEADQTDIALTVDAGDIWYSQRTIGSRYDALGKKYQNRLLSDIVTELQTGDGTLPFKLHVHEYKGRFYAINNQELWVLRQLQLGPLRLGEHVVTVGKTDLFYHKLFTLQCTPEDPLIMDLRMPFFELNDIILQWEMSDLLADPFADVVNQLPETYEQLDAYAASYVVPMLEEVHANFEQELHHLWSRQGYKVQLTPMDAPAEAKKRNRKNNKEAVADEAEQRFNQIMNQKEWMEMQFMEDVPDSSLWHPNTFVAFTDQPNSYGKDNLLDLLAWKRLGVVPEPSDSYDGGYAAHDRKTVKLFIRDTDDQQELTEALCGRGRKFVYVHLLGSQQQMHKSFSAMQNVLHNPRKQVMSEISPPVVSTLFWQKVQRAGSSLSIVSPSHPNDDEGFDAFGFDDFQDDSHGGNKKASRGGKNRNAGRGGGKLANSKGSPNHKARAPEIEDTWFSVAGSGRSHGWAPRKSATSGTSGKGGGKKLGGHGGEWAQSVTPRWVHEYCRNRAGLNEPQGSVVNELMGRCARGEGGVTLVQGPPGTGKTTTVIALLCGLATVGCNIVTCAPTNVAAVEVAARTLKMVKGEKDLGSFLTLNRVRGRTWKKLRPADLLLIGNREALTDEWTAEVSEIYLPDRAMMIKQLLDDSDEAAEKKKSRCLPASLHRLRKSFTPGTLSKVYEKKRGSQRSDKRSSKHHDNPQKMLFSSAFRDWVKATAGVCSKKMELLLNNIPAATLGEEWVKTYDDTVQALSAWIKAANGLSDNDLNFFHELDKTELGAVPDDKVAEYPALVQFFKLGATLSGILATLVPNEESGYQNLVPSNVSKALNAGVDKLEPLLISGAKVVFCTIFYGSSVLLKSSYRQADVLLIDEAAQVSEMHMLNLLRHKTNLQQLVLVGDPKQLPALIRSRRAAEVGLGRSFMERLYDLSMPCQLLDIQYRMHPDISSFPNLQFYHGRLKNAESIMRRTVLKDLEEEFAYGYRWHHVRGQEAIDNNTRSFYNEHEAEYIVNWIKLLKQRAEELRLYFTIGVITFYQKQSEYIQEQLSDILATQEAKQVAKLQEVLGLAHQDEIGCHVEVSTVDSFQGREKDMIMLSVVRTDKMGFITDHRRMNVALTRAKCWLWVVGDVLRVKEIGTQTFWEQLVEHAEENDWVENVPRDDGPSQSLYQADEYSYGVEDAVESRGQTAGGCSQQGGWASAFLDDETQDDNQEVQERESVRAGKGGHGNNGHTSRADEGGTRAAYNGEGLKARSNAGTAGSQGRERQNRGVNVHKAKTQQQEQYGVQPQQVKSESIALNQPSWNAGFDDEDDSASALQQAGLAQAVATMSMGDGNEASTANGDASDEYVQIPEGPSYEAEANPSMQTTTANGANSYSQSEEPSAGGSLGWTYKPPVVAAGADDDIWCQGGFE